ncbi:hypothetical protein [Microvirga terrestris]|uniref:Uncharacterized protein n=1 Tax=Microvirga terrestris TaxID=2791024 RepID=A0ABS0HPB8_9HYPH|nr:hypothetical protein [Microvirga terrestris]MBF9195326.1 hypothetical protein [Microvirga terrestris]
MFRIPMALVGLAGIFFVAGSFVPASFNMSDQAQSEVLADAGLPQRMNAPTKGDRMLAPVPSTNPATVSIVELVGVAQAAVILRDRDGTVLYKSDPLTGTTIYARDTDLPVVTLKEEMQAPATQHPVSQREGNEAPSGPKPKMRKPVGCLGDVSPLAKASADRMPSLCLALLEQSLS